MTTLIRPLGMTSARQTLTFPIAGYSQTVQAYIWGAGGGAGGNDGPRLGGSGSGGGYVSAAFTVNPGDVVEITVGSGGWSGRASSIKDDYVRPIFDTRTAIPQGRNTPLPAASATNVVQWSQFLNQFGVWNTGTALNGSTTSLADTLTFDQTFDIQIPFTGDFIFKFAAYYQGSVYLDGEKLFDSGIDSWKPQESGGVPFIRNLTPGYHALRIVAAANQGATYGRWGVGLTIGSTNNAGSGGFGLVRTIFDTRNTPASPPVYVPNPPTPAPVGTFSNLFADYAVWEFDFKAASCSRTYSVYFPYTGSYTVQMSAANSATLSIDGAPVYTTPTTTSYTTAYTVETTVTQGYHTVSFSATYSSNLPNAGVAIVISKSWSGATGGLAGPEGSSGGGGGSGGATTLVLNPKTTNETLIAVAVGGGGGGGAGASTVGQAESNAPGPRGQTAAGISSGQVGQDQGDFFKDGGGGGGGGPGGPGGAGRNGYSGEISYYGGGDAYGQAGSVGLSYLNPVATGSTANPTNSNVANQGPYYNLLPAVGQGALPGEIQAKHGGAVFIFNSFGPRVRDSAGWQEVKTIFVNVNGEWQQIDGMYVNQNGTWEPVVGTFVPTFEPQSDDFNILSRVSDHRPLPSPPPPPPPVYYDYFSRGCCCFVAGTEITMADGSIKSIEDVVIGDKLIGKDGMINTVIEYIRPTLGERTLVGFNGITPFITNDHPVLTIDGTWKSVDPAGTASKYAAAKLNAGQLSIGDTIATGDGVGFKIVSIEEHADSADLQVYNFSLNGNNTYIANGLVVHNKGQGGTSSNNGSCSSSSSASCSASGS
jgi:hypothetical protein